MTGPPVTHTAPLEILTPTAPPAASRSRRATARTSGIVMAVASALAFSSSGPLVKPLLEAGWSLSAALIVRMGLAGLILSPALVAAVRRLEDRAQPGPDRAEPGHVRVGRAPRRGLVGPEQGAHGLHRGQGVLAPGRFLGVDEAYGVIRVIGQFHL